MSVNLDKLTYAGNLESLVDLQDHPRYTFVRGDIGDRVLVKSLLEKFNPIAVYNLAAESHVDRSIVGGSAFLQTNVMGTFNLLEETRAYWSVWNQTEKNRLDSYMSQLMRFMDRWERRASLLKPQGHYRIHLMQLQKQPAIILSELFFIRMDFQL